MLNISIGSKKQLSLQPSQTAGQAPMMPEQEAHQLESSPQSSNLPPQQESAEASPAGSIEPDHFDDLLDAPEIGAIEGGHGGGLPPGMLGKDEFFKVFCMVFKVASIGANLKSMKVDPHDEAARAASDAVYETCAEIPALHFILQPQGRVMGRIVAIGMFVVPMAMNVQAEIAARQAARKGAPAGAVKGTAMTVPNYDMTGGVK